jgi:hypothetical protein
MRRSRSCARRFTHCGDVLAEDVECAAGRHVDAPKQVEQRGLAAAARTISAMNSPRYGESTFYRIHELQPIRYVLPMRSARMMKSSGADTYTPLRATLLECLCAAWMAGRAPR